MMIKGFKPRLYQEAILGSCATKNTLIVLPTGLGKTNIFLMIAAQRLTHYPRSKILFLGPTRPLINQYRSVFLKHMEIPEEDIVVFTGHVPPATREKQWKDARVIFSTPQGLENDLISKRIDIRDVSLLGLDEAHRAVGDYSYVWITKHYSENANHPRIIGLTASPGSDKEKIEEVCRNLYIENIEARSNEDADVKPYIKDINIKKVNVSLPEEFKKVKRYLDDCYNSKLAEIKANGFLNEGRYVSKRELLDLQRQLVAEMNQGNKDFQVLRSISLVAEAMKVAHGIELAESQGISPLKAYLDKIFSQASSSKVKAVKNLVQDVNFRSASILVDSLFSKSVEHPKLDKLKEIIGKTIGDDAKIIVFTQYRDSAVKIKDELNTMEGVKAELFVGQQKKGETGLSQKKQIEMLDRFREGGFNTIIMTSVGEEGLDIPSVDLVIFYEPVPSAIRAIQRRGRTGRQDEGNVMLLVTTGTKDETYHWAAHHKEKRMYRVIKDMSKSISLTPQARPKTLSDYMEEVVVYADYREKGSNVMKKLLEKGVSLKLEKLDNADYQLSPRVACEYKTTEDFVASLIDQRLLSQLKDLKRNFVRPVVIVEGTEDIYSLRKVHPNAIRGMIATITVSYGIPIIFTKNPIESSSMIWTIAKREQEQFGKSFSPHGDKKVMSAKEQQEYIVSSFPGIGPMLAKEFLKKFGTIRGFVNSDQDKLKEIPKVGEGIAQKLTDIFDAEYED